MWAIIILLALQVLDLGITLAKHGEPKEGNYNFWTTLFAAIVTWWLLYEAGLFDKYINT